MKTREDVLARIREYYEEEFPESDPTTEDTTNIGLAYTEVFRDEVPKKYRWYNYLPLPIQIKLNLETLSVTIHLGVLLVDRRTFSNYDELYDWVNNFEFQNVFSLKI